MKQAYSSTTVPRHSHRLHSFRAQQRDTHSNALMIMHPLVHEPVTIGSVEHSTSLQPPSLRSPFIILFGLLKVNIDLTSGFGRFYPLFSPTPVHILCIQNLFQCNFLISFFPPCAQFHQLWTSVLPWPPLSPVLQHDRDDATEDPSFTFIKRTPRPLPHHPNN